MAVKAQAAAGLGTAGSGKMEATAAADWVAEAAAAADWAADLGWATAEAEG